MITVGIAALNAARTLPDLLDSILHQRYPLDQMEIVIADNGSTDATEEIVRRYVDKGPIRLVRALYRRGPAVGRNAVIRAAEGDIIAFTDADCVVHPDWLAEIQAGFSDPQVGCVAGAILPGEPRTATERFYARHKIMNQELVLAHPFLPYAETANAAFRNEVFQRVGVFDEIMVTCEDADMLWRMQLQTDFQLRYRPEALVWHKHRGTPRGLFRQTVGWGTGHALVYRKYRGQVCRDSWGKVLADYRRIVRLGALTLHGWVGARTGRSGADSWEDTYLSLLYHAGAKVGRLKGSFAARVLYP